MTPILTVRTYRVGRKKSDCALKSIARDAIVKSSTFYTDDPCRYSKCRMSTAQLQVNHAQTHVFRSVACFINTDQFFSESYNWLCCGDMQLRLYKTCLT